MRCGGAAVLALWLVACGHYTPPKRLPASQPAEAEQPARVDVPEAKPSQGIPVQGTKAPAQPGETEKTP